MAVGSILEICVGSIDSSNYPGQHKISVLFEKKFGTKNRRECCAFF